MYRYPRSSRRNSTTSLLIKQLNIIVTFILLLNVFVKLHINISIHSFDFLFPKIHLTRKI